MRMGKWQEPSRVAVLHCPTYEEVGVEQAIGRGLDLLGGAETFARPGEHILLKPNLLVGSRPSQAVTTHPAVFRGVARHLKRCGAVLTYGDSPGFGTTMGAAHRSGLVEVAEAEGIRPADFATGRSVSFPDGRQNKQFTVAAAALDADGIVSLPKLKAHGLTRMTGAVKNQFGCIPGLLKSEFHLRMGTMDRFGQMLVDLNRLLQPRLFVMDAIVAMEGNGPRSGDPRQLSALLLSSDPVALDAVACRLVGLDPALVVTVRWGQEYGLGSYSHIELLGDPLEPLVVPSFVINRRPGSTTGISGRWGRLARNLVVPRPAIRPDLCTACGTCVRVCPVTPEAVAFAEDPGLAAVRPDAPLIAEPETDPPTAPGSSAPRRPPVHHYSRCIRCYCCQEMCPQRAIEIDRPLLGRILHHA